MNVTEKTKTQFLNQVRDLLVNHPDRLSNFEVLWHSGRFREAYLVVSDAIRFLGISLTGEQQKIDENFYWEIVN
jgi:hypothetical protein